jgi:hypothetical protein
MLRQQCSGQHRDSVQELTIDNLRLAQLLQSLGAGFHMCRGKLYAGRRSGCQKWAHALRPGSADCAVHLAHLLASKRRVHINARARIGVCEEASHGC